MIDDDGCSVVKQYYQYYQNQFNMYFFICFSV